MQEAADPLESARSIIIEVLLNAMSSESSNDHNESSGSKAENLITPIDKDPPSPLPKIKARQESTERPAGTNSESSVISTQLLFSQLTTTIAHAVIEKLSNETTRNSVLTSIPSVSDDGPPLPFLARQDDDNATSDGDPGATPATNDADQEYEDDVMIVTYGSFVDNPGKL